MTYKVTRRVLKGANTVGFEITSGLGDVKYLSRYDTIKAAQNGWISNVTADTKSDSLHGVGVDLRKLPTVQYDSIKKAQAQKKSLNARAIPDDDTPNLEVMWLKLKAIGANPYEAIFDFIEKREKSDIVRSYLYARNGGICITLAGIESKSNLIKYVTSFEGLFKDNYVPYTIIFPRLAYKYLKSTKEMFRNTKSETWACVDIKDLNTSSVKDASWMFAGCRCPISGIYTMNTYSMRDISHIFENSRIGLAEAKPNREHSYSYADIDYDEDDIDYNEDEHRDLDSVYDDDLDEEEDELIILSMNLKGWEVGQVVNMERAFFNCNLKLSGLDLWNVSNVLNFKETFACYAPIDDDYGPLPVLDLSGWKLNPRADTTNMFYNCQIRVRATDPRIIAEAKKAGVPILGKPATKRKQ